MAFKPGPRAPDDSRAGGPDPDTESPDGVESFHRPVLAEPSIASLVTRKEGRYLDGTVGGGGHLAKLMSSLGAGARVLGMDRDPHAIETTRRRVGDDERVVLRQAAFGDLARIAGEEGMLPLDGILLDLGVSSRQLDDPERGFTYREEASLDMRMDPGSARSAADLLETLSIEELTTLLQEGGEVRSARRLARSIANVRNEHPLRKSSDLRRLVESLVPPHRLNAELSRVFQALRIRVNDEMAELDRALDHSIEALGPGGRMVVISYHSLEDRKVKRFFRERSKSEELPPGYGEGGAGPALRLITRKPIRPSEDEIAENPRARSASMRVAERTAEEEVAGVE